MSGLRYVHANPGFVAHCSARGRFIVGFFHKSAHPKRPPLHAVAAIQLSKNGPSLYRVVGHPLRPPYHLASVGQCWVASPFDPIRLERLRCSWRCFSAATISRQPKSCPTWQKIWWRNYRRDMRLKLLRINRNVVNGKTLFKYREMAKRTPAPAPLPMPIHLVTNHPTTRALAGLSYNLVLVLCVAYWESECRPLTTVKAERAILARVDVTTYIRRDVVISAALDILLPMLAQTYETRLAQAEDRRARTARMYARQQAEGRAMHASPHHVSRTRRKDMAAKAQQIAAQAVMDAAGMQERRLAEREQAGATVASRGVAVDIPPAHVVQAVAGQAQTPLSEGGKILRRGMLDARLPR